LLDDVLHAHEVKGARIVLGDFNEWTRGLASRLLAAQFQSADPRRYMGRARAYPGVLPLLHLDHIYFDSALTLCQLRLHRSRKALVASDHLPLVADLELRPSISAASTPTKPAMAVDSARRMMHRVR
jgi:endonuclease/exonuclease/phosphatase family metal-dependent hydrolase